MRRKRKYASARERIRKRYPELFEPGANEIGIASDFISDIRSLKSGKPVVIYCRVSSSDQDYKQNLSDQMVSMQDRIKQKGYEIIRTIKDVCSGWQEERDGLLLAAKIAQKNKAVVVAESPTRLIRSRDFNSKTNWKVQPTVAEYRRLQRDTRGVKLATLVNPDATPEEIRSHETRRGKNAKGNPGGRPRKRCPGYKLRIRQEYLPKVLDLYERRKNKALIARMTGLNYNTVYSWIRKYS